MHRDVNLFMAMLLLFTAFWMVAIDCAGIALGCVCAATFNGIVYLRARS